MSDPALAIPQVPRIVWLCWLQGLDAAPPLVPVCVASWRRQNPNWSVRLVTADNIRDYLDPAFCDAVLASDLEPKKKANIFRMALIGRHGGVWADADAFCARPLDTWIDEATQAGFFAFRFHKSDAWLFDPDVSIRRRLTDRTLDRVMGNWFLAAHAGNHVATEFAAAHFSLLQSASRRSWHLPQALAGRLFRRLRRNAYLSSLVARESVLSCLGCYPYFIFHYHFARMLRTNPQFRATWEKVPARDAVEPLSFVDSIGLPVDATFRDCMSGKRGPVYKLPCRRTDPQQGDVETQFDWLMKTFDDGMRENTISKKAV